MLQTGSGEKVVEKNGVICLVAMFPSLILLQQFMHLKYMHLKFLITVFQIMLWFKGV